MTPQHLHNIVPSNTPRPLSDRFNGRTKCQDIAQLPVLMADHGVRLVHSVYFADDGWFDGVDALHAIVEDEYGIVYKVKLGDSGRWFAKRHGWSLIHGDISKLFE